MTASEFAREMWPESPAWNRFYKCGPSGATRGRGLVKSAGSFLGKLRKQGLAELYWDRRLASDQHIVSQQGRRELSG